MSVTCHGLTGFECGLLSTSGGGIANTTLGSACTISASSPRHGTYHLHVATTSSSPSSVTFLHSGTPNKTLCRFGVAIRSLPAATGNARGMLAFSGASGGQWQIFCLSTGVVQLYAGGVTQNGPNINDGAYHVIEVQADTSTNPWTLSWIVDGVTQTPVSNPQSAVTVTLFAFGEGALTNNAYTADFDDLIFGAWTGTTDWFGDGKVLGYPAASDGTHLTPADFIQGDAGSAFSGATTTANTFVDEIPWSATRSTTDSIGQGTTGISAYMEIKCATNAETVVANAVRALIGLSAASATANTAGCIALNSLGGHVPVFGDLPAGQGGGGGALANYGVSSNTFKAALVPRPGAQWTPTEVNSVKLRFGGSDDVSPVPTLQTLMLEVDWSTVAPSPPVPPPFSIREEPPLRLSIDVETADHRHFRWAGDESDPANVPSGLQFSSTMPGGFESLSCVLPRKSNLDYSDLQEYATITASGFAGTVAGQGRLSTQPRTSGDQMAVTPAALGWQTHLDDQQVRAIYLDMDQSKWTDMPGTRLNAVSAFAWVQNASEQVVGSPSGGPAMRTSVTGDVSTTNVSEAWYDSLGIPIAGLFYGWYRGATITPLTHWQWTAWLLDDPVTFGDGGTGLAATGPDSGYVPATVPTRRNAMVQLSWNDGSGLTADVVYPIDWTVLSVVGNHGLTLNGGDENVAPTLLASDIVGHAISAWCPKFTGNIHIDRGGYYISQLAFTDQPVPVSEIIRQCARFLLEDWAVWEGPSFWWTARGARARQWRARAGPAQLQEAGPDATQLFNEVIVSYQDVDGTTLTVGPPGSLVNIEDAGLRDSDPENPVTAAGLTRRTLLSMGTGVSGDAIFIGRAFLAEQKLVNHAGQATLTGIVQDAGGVLWPAWMVRAGDEISFTDAADTSPRRIVQASYDHDSRTCQVSLDSPPDALSAILERIGASIATVGFA